jgi:hypothetical protein
MGILHVKFSIIIEFCIIIKLSKDIINKFEVKFAQYKILARKTHMHFARKTPHAEDNRV